MPYNENIAHQLREHLEVLPGVEEKEMMGGLVFMYREKMLVGVMKDALLCRIDPAIYEEAIEEIGCRPMDFTGKPMKGWVLVEEEALNTKTKFEYWINLALDYNDRAKKSKKKSLAK